jgi:hypothetical protein
MKHAGPEALSALAALLAEIRKREGLVERRPGVFYRKGRAVLHFHEDPSGLHADVRLGAAWERLRVETRAERQALLSRLGEALSKG